MARSKKLILNFVLDIQRVRRRKNALQQPDLVGELKKRLFQRHGSSSFHSQDKYVEWSQEFYRQSYHAKLNRDTLSNQVIAAYPMPDANLQDVVWVAFDHDEHEVKCSVIVELVPSGARNTIILQLFNDVSRSLGEDDLKIADNRVFVKDHTSVEHHLKVVQDTLKWSWTEGLTAALITIAYLVLKMFVPDGNTGLVLLFSMLANAVFAVLLLVIDRLILRGKAERKVIYLDAEEK